MGDFGRIHVFLITNRSGNVLYERFYEQFTNLQKAELRAAMQEASSPYIDNLVDTQVEVSTYRDAVIAFMLMQDVLLYCIGSGEYNELACKSILRLIAGGLKHTLKKTPTEATIVEKYCKTCVTVDEIINEGMLDHIDPEVVHRAIKMKAPSSKSRP